MAGSVQQCSTHRFFDFGCVFGKSWPPPAAFSVYDLPGIGRFFFGSGTDQGTVSSLR